jgi:hypothetical protein
MSLFDTGLITTFAVLVVSLAAVALVLSLGVVATTVLRNRQVRLSRHQSRRTYYGRMALHH